MAARTKRQVDSNEVRQWANETDWRDELDRPVAERGRMPSGLIDAYNRANARHNKEYVPIPRPVRSDYRETATAQKASTQRASRSTASTGTATRTPAKATAAASAPSAPVASAPVNTDSEGVQSVQEVIAMLTAAGNKRGGRPALVTIQTLVNV